MIVSLAEAAKLVGKSRQTVYRYANTGRMSVTRLDDGTKGVDTSELERVFGDITVQEAVTGVTVTETVTSDSVRQGETANVTALESELEAARATIRLHQERIDELKADKSKLWDQVESQRLLLEHKNQPVQVQKISKPMTITQDAAALIVIVGIGLAVLAVIMTGIL